MPGKYSCTQMHPDIMSFRGIDRRISEPVMIRVWSPRERINFEGEITKIRDEIPSVVQVIRSGPVWMKTEDDPLELTVRFWHFLCKPCKIVYRVIKCPALRAKLAVVFTLLVMNG